MGFLYAGKKLVDGPSLFEEGRDSNEGRPDINAVTNFSVAFVNIAGLKRADKQSVLHNVVSHNNFDVSLLAETHFDEVSAASFDARGFDWIYRCRVQEQRRGGGVGCLARKKWKMVPLSVGTQTCSEILWIQPSSGSVGPLAIGVVYCGVL